MTATPDGRWGPGEGRIGPLAPEHAGEVLTVQRAAYLVEAQRYATLLISPLVETLEQVRADIAAPEVLTLGAWWGHRLVGSVRGRVAGESMEVSRLAVAPDMQGRGVGRALLAAVESAAPPVVRTVWLVTGHRSENNIRLYQRAGYRGVGTTTDPAGVLLLRMEKPLHRSSMTAPR